MNGLVCLAITIISFKLNLNFLAIVFGIIFVLNAIVSIVDWSDGD